MKSYKSSEAVLDFLGGRFYHKLLNLPESSFELSALSFDLKKEIPIMQCPLCGYTFSPEEGEKSCGGCPIGKGCDLVCCPHCHYQWPAGSKAEKFLRRLFAKEKIVERVGEEPSPDGGSRA